MNYKLLMRLFLSILLFVTVLLAHAHSKVIVSTDSMWSVYLAQSLVKDGDLVLDEYKEQAKERKNYGLRKRKGQLYSYFPVGTALMASPFVYIFNIYPKVYWFLIPEVRVEEQPRAETYNLTLQRTIASVFVAVTVVALFFIFQSLIGLYPSFCLALLAAFATPLWSTASRGLWQHGPSAMLISLSLIILLKARKADLAGLTGLLLAFAYVVRPTNAVIYILVATYLIFFRPRALVTYIISSAIVFVPFVMFSYSFLDRIMPPYYLASRLQIGWHFPHAFTANLFSPNRGILFLSPILLPAFWEMLKLLNKIIHDWNILKSESFSVLVMLCFFGHLTAISLFPEWWGGHAFGARYMCETVPYLMYFLALWISRFKISFLKVCLFAAAALFSFYTNYVGATRMQAYLWNVRPVNIDRNPQRVWDLKDLQFLR